MKKPNPKKDPSDSLQNLIFKLSFLLLLLFFFILNLFFFHFFTTSPPTPPPPPCTNPLLTRLSQLKPKPTPEPQPRLDPTPEETTLRHVVFGIGSSVHKLQKRKLFLRLWWRPNSTRGFLFLDRPVNLTDSTWLPEIRVSSSPPKSLLRSFKGWPRISLRVTRIVSDLVRITEPDGPSPRWFVLGDDDTLFYPDNLVRVLRKYDHTQKYYIGSNSEDSKSNIMLFTKEMAYGGGGIALSYPLAKAMEKILDGCIQRYPKTIGSDDRIRACVSELGVPLTKEPGFHQMDVSGNLFGLLTAHPIAPLVSIHHLEKFEPIFPFMNQFRAFARLRLAAHVDSAGLLQQSICYDSVKNWTVSVSWGYAVQIIRGWVPAHEMKRPVRTFHHRLRRKASDDPAGYSINTRPISKEPCEEPYVYFLSNVGVNNDNMNWSMSEYLVHPKNRTQCLWKMESPDRVLRVEVYKILNPRKWDKDKAPRRDCCRVLPTDKEGTMIVDVVECGEGEIIAP